MTAPANPLVTVIIPAFNRAGTLAAALRSVFDQDYSPIEIIVVNDASTDGTVEVASQFGNDVKILHHDVRKGGSAARNTGIMASSGELLAFLDSDDEWLPTKLRSQVETWSRRRGQVGLIYCGAEICEPGEAPRYKRPPKVADASTRLLFDNIVGSASVAMVPRSVAVELGGFDPDLPAMQDIDFWLRIAQRYDLELVDSPLVRIHHGTDGVRITRNHRAALEARTTFLTKHRDALRNAGVTNRLEREIGRLCQFRIGDTRSARTWYRAAFRSKVTDATSFLMWASTFMPPVAMRIIVKQRRGLRRGTQSRSYLENASPGNSNSA